MQLGFALEDTRPERVKAVGREAAQRVRNAHAAIVEAMGVDDPELRLVRLDAIVRTYQLKPDDNSDGHSDWVRYQLGEPTVKLFMEYRRGPQDNGAQRYLITLKLRDGDWREQQSWTFEAGYVQAPIYRRWAFVPEIVE